MANQTSGEVYAGAGANEQYGLHAGVLGPLETLAQSVAAVAPSTSPSLTIPLVFVLAGNATWFVYLLAMAATLMVGFCVSRFARLSASPGSLYSYAAGTLPPAFGVVAAWGLLLAYLATGASVAGGALYYGRVLCQEFFGWTLPALPTLAGLCLVAGVVAYLDVKLSAEMMLWIEAVSVGLIVIVLLIMIFHYGLKLDMDQLSLKGVRISALGPALVLAMFSFVGFESATTLGSETRDPLKTIPRAVLQSAVLTGGFFVLCSYSVVLGFRGATTQLSESTSPMHQLAAQVGVSPLGVAIDIGVSVAAFSCILACTTAAARVLLRMSHEGLMPELLQGTSKRHGTPGPAIVLSAGVMLAAAEAMTLNGVSAAAIYDLLGSLSVFGFLTAYALVAAALPFARRALGQHSHLVAAASVVTVLVLIVVVIFDLQSASDVNHARIPWIYLGYLALGLVWSSLNRAWTNRTKVNPAKTGRA